MMVRLSSLLKKVLVLSYRKSGIDYRMNWDKVYYYISF